MPKSVIDLNAMQAAAGEAAALLRALAHEDRLLLLCQLSQGQASVSELEQSCGILQPSLSQHLGVLRRQGLVEAKRDGRRQLYQISDPNALAVLQLLYARYCPN